MSVFTGFKTYKAPIYTVTCPHSGYQFDVRSLNVGEMIKLKESLVTDNKIGETILDIIWDVVEKGTLPAHIVNKSDFSNYITTNDRNAIVYGIHSITFGSKDYSLTCGFCGSENKSKIDYSEHFNIKPYPFAENIIESYKLIKTEDSNNKNEVFEEILNEKNIKSIISEFNGSVPPVGQPEGMARIEPAFQEFFQFVDNNEVLKTIPYNDILNVYKQIKNNEVVAEKYNKTSKNKIDPDKDDIFNKRLILKLPTSGVVITIKCPTLSDELNVFKRLTLNTQSQLALATDVLFIEKFEEYNSNNELVQVIDEKIDVLNAYKLLPLQDREFIIEQYDDNFGQYGIEIPIKWTCKGCKEVNELEVDIIAQFFRSIISTK